MKEIYAFYNTHSEYTKNYGSHKENYMRFGIRTFVTKVNMPIFDLITELERQYTPNSEDQNLLLEGRDYLVRVAV